MLNIVSQEVINKGWSDDRKYLLTAESEISTMLAQARDVFSWYDGMRSVIPGWYHSIENKDGTD